MNVSLFLTQMHQDLRIKLVVHSKQFVYILPFNIIFQCNHKATKQSNLKEHIESVHEGVKYPCSQCDYKAIRQFEDTYRICS